MRIIHCADIHLDSSLNTHLTIKQATIRKNEILNTFYRMTVFAKENDVKTVLIAGDLFDEESVTKSTIDLLFSFIKETSILIIFMSQEIMMKNVMVYLKISQITFMYLQKNGKQRSIKI